MTSKTPNLDNVRGGVDLEGDYSPFLKESAVREAAEADIAALESAHAEEFRKLRAELDEANRRMATMVCGTCYGTKRKYYYEMVNTCPGVHMKEPIQHYCHDCQSNCPVCQPKEPNAKEKA